MRRVTGRLPAAGGATGAVTTRRDGFVGSRWAYRGLQGLFRLYFCGWLRVRVEGMAQVPREGPMILSGNHDSAWDPLLISTILSDPVVHLTKIELFRSRPLAWALRHLGCIPVDRSRGDRRAIRQALEALARGQALVIFPEGTRSGHEGRLGEFKQGTAFLATRAGAVIQSFAICGRYRRGQLVVRFGACVHAQGEDRAALTQWLSSAIADAAALPAGADPPA